MKFNLYWFLGWVAVVVLFVTPLVLVDYWGYITDLIESFPYFAPVIVIVFRFIGVVLAPLPGAPVSFASIAFLPWHEAWLYNFIGAELGSICAFLIARRFRESVVARFASLQHVHEW